MPVPSPPLAARMRPRTLDEVVGQEHILGPGAPFRRALDGGQLLSVLLWGPPGCGKTTLARLLANRSGVAFVQLSAVATGLAELRKVVNAAEADRQQFGRGTLLFVDEIHRWNKAQQDALLPHVEEGLVTLVGATTENPGFQVIPALRSRCRLLVLNPHTESDLVKLLERAVASDQGLARRPGSWTTEALEALAAAASGDARRALSLLEECHCLATPGLNLDLEVVGQVVTSIDLLHDRDGDSHYDISSALIKSLRGSDPDAALYWMARLLEGGDDPMFVARRLVVFASEDVGNAEPRALPLAVAAMQATHMLGMPEARIVLGQACTFLASAPKSNRSYKAVDAAIAAVRQHGPLPVPLHLRNAPSDLARKLGHGDGYKYPHDFPDHIVDQAYLPDALVGARYYDPAPQGAEKTIRERLQWWRDRLAAQRRR